MKSSKKILFISDFFPPFAFGGAEISTSLIVRYISKFYKCAVLTQDFQKKPWIFNNVKVYSLIKQIINKKSLNNPFVYLFNTLFHIPFNFFVCRRFIRRYNPDLVNIT